jgi:predicted ATP-grasp superfamily ATP-dependent carboligase
METKSGIIIISLLKERQGISRLPAALKSSGFKVSAICHTNSYLAKTKYLDQLIPWTGVDTTNALSKMIKVIQIIEQLQPHLVIPADEGTIVLLFQTLKMCKLWHRYAGVRAVLERSLFREEFLHQTIVKDAFINFAAGLGIRVPRNYVIHTREEALELAASLQFPVVLKRAVGSSGRQVTIHENFNTLASELMHIFRLRGLREMKYRVTSFLSNSFNAINNYWSLQQFVQGETAMFVFVAGQGKILGHLPLYKKQTYPGKTGPSSVIQSFNCPEMLEFATKIVEKIEFNGFGSLDFIVDAQSQQPYVIEFNPRPVPACHLGQHFNVDLCQLLADCIQGKTPAHSDVLPSQTIALFPSEYFRDPQSPYLKTAFHDIPWEDEDLMAALAPEFVPA